MLHNYVVARVHDRLLENTPRDSSEYSDIVLEETRSVLCDGYGKECENFVAQHARRARESVRAGDFLRPREHLDSVLPKKTHERTRTALYSIIDAVGRVDNDDEPLENALAEIEEVAAGVAAAADDVDELDVVGVRMVAEVAMRSSEYWKEAQRDENNAFRRLHEIQLPGGGERRRSLQDSDNDDDENELVVFATDLLINAAPFIFADVLGAAVGFFLNTLIWGAIYVVTFFIVGNPLFIIFGTLVGAVIASLEALGLYFPDPIKVFTCIISAIQENQCNVTELFPPLITENIGPVSEFVWESSITAYNYTVEVIVPAIDEAIPVVTQIIYDGWLFIVNLFYPEWNEDNPPGDKWFF